MQVIKNKEHIGNFLFTIGMILELIVMVTDASASWTLPYRGRVTHVAFILFCLKILMTKYSKKNWFLFVVFCIIGSISYLTCDDEYIIRCVLFVAASYGINVRKNLKIIFWGTFVSTVIIILLSIFGVCGKVVDIRHYGRGVEEARYCLGFSHANNVHDTYWYLLSIYFLVKDRKIKTYEYVVLTIINIFLYCLTLSRTGVIVVQAVIVMMIIVQYSNVVTRFGLVQMVCVFALGSSLFLTLLAAENNIYQSRIVAKLDPIFTGRLELVYEYANNNDWEVFPPSRTVTMVDNGFASIIYTYGTLVGTLLVIVILVEILWLFKNKDSKLSVILLGTIIIFFMEATYIINISLLCNMLLIVLMCNGLEVSKTYEKSIADNTSI